MKLIRGTRIALATLFGHKLRTALATLGIVIGVCSVIVMVAIGEGAQREVLSKIQSMGTDLVIVTSGQVKVHRGAAAPDRQRHDTDDAGSQGGCDGQAGLSSCHGDHRSA